jgi:hypothetical protein
MRWRIGKAPHELVVVEQQSDVVRSHNMEILAEMRGDLSDRPELRAKCENRTLDIIGQGTDRCITDNVAQINNTRVTHAPNILWLHLSHLLQRK